MIGVMTHNRAEKTGKVSKAMLADIEPLSILFNQYRIFYDQPSDLNAARCFLRERLLQNDAEILICRNPKADIVGFVQLYPLFSSVRLRKLWLLNDLFIQEQHRRQGYSTLLIEATQTLCSETDACGLMLETGIKNTAGNELYRKTGFETCADSNFYSWANK